MRSITIKKGLTKSCRRFATNRVTVLASLLLVCVIRHANADGSNDFQLAQAAPSGSPSGSEAIPGAVSNPHPYSLFDSLSVKGLNISLPPPSDTVDGQLFGARDRLADIGIGYLFFTNTFFEDNLVRHALPLNNSRSNQQYIGQEPTYLSANFAYLTYDLSRFGIPDGQIVLGATYLDTNWNPLGPRTTSLSTATYYQTLFNKKVELKFGYLGNGFEFLGTYVGGSIAGGIFGPNASIATEQGENSTVYATPAINVKLNVTNYFYTKFGVQRAISPDGTIVEHNENPSAVRFTVPNAGVLIIDETGYRTKSSPGLLGTWIRAAASSTSSKYYEYNPSVGLTTQRGNHNFGLFLLADQQLLQSSPSGKAAQGLYAGFSVMHAPSEFNLFSTYYEARIYGVGLIPRRPTDLLSLVFTDSIFSGYAVEAARNSGQLAHPDSKSYTAAYSAHVSAGININLGVTYTDNPTSVIYNEHTGSALNIFFGTVAFF